MNEPWNICIEMVEMLIFDGAEEQEWPHSSYPPWAHGPGYIVSEDIARFIVKGHQEMELMVKLMIHIQYSSCEEFKVEI